MKTTKILPIAVMASLLLISCNADDVQLQNENVRFTEMDDFVLKEKDTVFYEITTVANDSLCDGEYEPPLVPKPPIKN